MFMRALINNSPKYYCPRCNSTEIVDHGEYIECLKCCLDFFKDHIGEINNKNILAAEELKGIIDSFEDLKDKKIRKGFLKSIENDNF